MTTMFNATLQLAGRLKVLKVSTATGGSTTTIVDTKRTESIDAFNGGGAWIITDAGGESAAPEGEWAHVTDWAASGTTATISAVTAAVASGDTYGIAVGYTIHDLIIAINDEITKQKVTRYDRTSLDIVSGQSEYTLPAGIRQDNLVNVYEETDTDTSDSQPTQLSFEVQTAAAGSQHKLVIKSRGVTAGNDIMLEYTTAQSPLYLATDTIDGSILMARILDNAAAGARATKMLTTGSESELEVALWKAHREDAVLARAENPVRRKAKRGNINEAAGD